MSALGERLAVFSTGRWHLAESQVTVYCTVRAGRPTARASLPSHHGTHCYRSPTEPVVQTCSPTEQLHTSEDSGRRRQQSCAGTLGLPSSPWMRASFNPGQATLPPPQRPTEAHHMPMRRRQLSAMGTWVLLALSALLLPPCRATGRTTPAPVEVTLDTANVSRPWNWADDQAALNDFPGALIKLVDCEFSNGPPHGLSCDKEGTFVVGFEKRGQWIAGGGAVPLSRALCCRLSPPGNVTSPGQPDVPLTPSKPVAVVSFGCHMSSGEAGAQVMCEAVGNSFLTGFATAVGVGLRMDTFYPLGRAQCCTPALLLENGELWTLERCNCRRFDNLINCPHEGGYMSTGFGAWRVTRSANFVPVAPDNCCQVCLGSQIKPADDCSDMRLCTGHGHCSYGRCECFQGWEGADCSRSSHDRSNSMLDSWQLAVVIIGAAGILASLLILCSHLYRLQQREDLEGEDDFLEPLLGDENGSVGSVDTSDEEGEDPLDDECECVEEDEDEDEAAGEGTSAPSVRAYGGQPEAERPDGPAADSGEPEVQDAGSAEHTPPAAETNNFTMADTAECLVCMQKPIQAVLVPCGHAVACRRCCRRLLRCPMCRTDILRRQRLFLGK